ncbi:MAG: TIR domain-containing protein [Anaerolineae bacterium]|jgi:hypothetical protein|nr:TIR domain-containing protein [Anaerolineae bacterium]
MTARIFISYSRKDAAFARQIATSLSDAGADVWIDVEDIPAGMKWSTAIQHGLRHCEVMIVILSPDSMASINVEDEWQYFLDKKKPIVPILWRPTEIHFQLSRIQWVNFCHHPYNDALLRLFNELQRNGCDLPTPTYLEPTARNRRYSNAAPTQERPPTPVTRPMFPQHQAVTLRHRPKTPPYAALVGSCVVLVVLAAMILLPRVNSAPLDATPTPTLTEMIYDAIEGRPTVNLNVRLMDNPNSPRVGALRLGEIAEIIGINRWGNWYYVRLPNRRYGWVSATYLQVSGDTGNLTVIDPNNPPQF